MEKKVHEKALEKLNNANSSHTKIFNCRTFVTVMGNQLQGLIPRMDAAISAIDKLAQISNSQVRNLELVLDNLEKIRKGTDSTVAVIRRSNIKSGVKRASEKYEEVKKAALAFEKDARLKVKPKEQK